MPHLTIKHFPRDFTDAQREQLAAALTRVVLDHFDTYDGAVSIALEPVAKPDWGERVVAPEITERAHLLIKAPQYR